MGNETERNKNIENALKWLQSLNINDLPSVPCEISTGIEVVDWSKCLRSIIIGLESKGAVQDAALYNARIFYKFKKKNESKTFHAY